MLTITFYIRGLLPRITLHIFIMKIVTDNDNTRLNDTCTRSLTSVPTRIARLIRTCTRHQGAIAATYRLFSSRSPPVYIYRLDWKSLAAAYKFAYFSDDGIFLSTMTGRGKGVIVVITSAIYAGEEWNSDILCERNTGLEEGDRGGGVRL